MGVIKGPDEERNALGFEAEVRQWGNSLGVVVPKSVRESLSLEKGEKVTVTITPQDKYVIELPPSLYKSLRKEAEYLSKLPQFKGYTVHALISHLFVKSSKPNEVAARKAKELKDYTKFLDLYYEAWRSSDNYTFNRANDKKHRSIKKELQPILKRFANYKPKLEKSDFNKALLTEFRKLGDFEAYSDEFLLKVVNCAVLRNFTRMPLAQIDEYVAKEFGVKDMVKFFDYYAQTVFKTFFSDLCRAFIKVAKQFPTYPVKQ